MNELNSIIDSLVNEWCSRKALNPLRHILSGWPHNGLTDEYYQLRDALDKTRSISRNDITDSEERLISKAINILDKALKQ